MFQHLLVAIDGSDSSLTAAETAIEIAALLHAHLDMLSVEETPPRYISAQEEVTREHTAALTYFEHLHAPLRRKAEQRGVQTQTRVRSGHVGQVILDYLVAEACDLLILGYQGHSGVWGAFLGSTADKVMTHAPCSTLVVRKLGRATFKSILLAFNGSPLSWQALQVALQLAPLCGAQLHLLSVLENSKAPTVTGSLSLPSEGQRPQADWQAYFQRVQAVALEQAHQAHVTMETHLTSGSASGSLTVAAQEQGSDLLILGATGHEHPWDATIGGTARKVANEVPCAVLIVHPLTPHFHVRDVMRSSVSTVSLKTPVTAAITLLVERQDRLLVVVNEQQQVQGVMTLGMLLAHEDVLHQLSTQPGITAQQFAAYLRQFFAQKLVEAVMKYPVITVQADTPLEAAARWMMTHHVTRVPIVDASNRPLGILDQTALLSYYTTEHQHAESAQERKTTETAQQEAVDTIPRTVGEVRRTAVPLIGAETPLPDILSALQTTPLRHVIVVNESGKAIGVIGENDLYASLYAPIQQHPVRALVSRLFPYLSDDSRPAQAPPVARQIMRLHLFSVMLATPLTEIVHLMLREHLKLLVVVDDADIPQGMVDREQIVRFFVESSTKEDL
jgi:nucleotide-binding universal stress UspA family protein/CBS-domain-containing membrane protein